MWHLLTNKFTCWHGGWKHYKYKCVDFCAVVPLLNVVCLVARLLVFRERCMKTCCVFLNLEMSCGVKCVCVRSVEIWVLRRIAVIKGEMRFSKPSVWFQPSHFFCCFRGVLLGFPLCPSKGLSDPLSFMMFLGMCIFQCLVYSLYNQFTFEGFKICWIMTSLNLVKLWQMKTIYQ